MKKFILISIVILLSCLAGGVTYVYQNLDYKTSKNHPIEIKQGMAFYKINTLLKQKKIIKDSRFFHHYCKYKKQVNNFKSGSYIIPAGSNLEKVLHILTTGKSVQNKVTISEGKNIYEVANILEQNNLVDAKTFIALCKSKSFLSELNIPSNVSFEGYLFPETYFFPKGYTEKQIIRTMVKQFKQQISSLDFSQTHLSQAQVINLASIVEKETGAAWERPIIAGVYLNRLKKNMRLQADPTTIYGIWESYKGNLRKRHLLEKTPYNTYKISGLPLGPIANPSLAAIKAVLVPKKHNYLYFVSKNDGTHIFTPTYKEHLKAVRQWQLNKKNREGKSWRDLKKKF
ncbi:MAG: endolytic transglycosylase MltG [Bacteriovoracaceae bacterium]|jgi:UPF0755 protein|nr:endolytic transglycosylase MltG [Bacteriovoracaceae bacterium]